MNILQNQYYNSRIDILDKNMVVRLFIYENDIAEIDIEFSKWGNPLKMDTQYVIQPCYITENKERFNIKYKNIISSIHSIDWKESKITFLSLFQNIKSIT